MIPMSGSKLGHLGSRTRSSGKIKEITLSPVQGDSLTLCYFVVYSTGRFVLVLPGVILFLGFSVL